MSRAQLLRLGVSADGIKHRVATGRLHPLWRSVYAVGRPQITRHARLIAATMACGCDAVISHETAAALWEISFTQALEIEVSVPPRACPRRAGIRVHRRAALGTSNVTRHCGIAVTTVPRTLIDIAPRLGREKLEAAINAADKRDLIDPESLREALLTRDGQPGVAVLRETLDRRTFTLTDSELERRFLPLARRAGLPAPHTGRRVNGFKVDFHWPDLGLVVETDGLRYHRTPAQQAKDRVRDQAHAAAGLTPLRFTRAQVRFDPAHVEAILAAVAYRLTQR